LPDVTANFAKFIFYSLCLGMGVPAFVMPEFGYRDAIYAGI